MRAILLLGALCFVALGCGRAPKGDAKARAPEGDAKTRAPEGDLNSRTAENDLKALQGSWQVVSAIDRGKPVPADKLEVVQFEFQGDALVTSENGKGQERSSFTLDTTQSPRVMRLSVPENEKPVVEAIYEVRGDTLKFAFTKNGKPRPTSFDADPPRDIQLFVFKRKK